MEVKRSRPPGRGPWKLLALMLALVFSARATAAPRVVSKSAEGFDPALLKRAAFLPLVRVLPQEDDRSVLHGVCPRDGAVYDACKVEEAAEAELSGSLGRALAEGGGVSWVAQEEINAARVRVKERDPALSPGGPLQLALGRELQADAVLFGYIYCYRNRSGNAYASSAPAAVGFCLHLVEPATGKELWSFSYADEQRALSDNLLDAPAYLQRKGRWITAAQMAEEAAAAMVKVLPWRGPAGEEKKH